MTTRLTLVCHAESSAMRDARFPADEVPEDGDLAAAGVVLSSSPLRAALAKAGRRYVAPERRTRGTAVLMGGDFIAEPALRDVDAGRWRGQTLAAVAAEEPRALSAWMTFPGSPAPGGESIADLVERVRAWMTLQASRGGRVLAVTHPALVRAAVVETLGSGPEAFWHVEAAALTVADVGHDGRRWSLRGLATPPRPKRGSGA